MYEDHICQAPNPNETEKAVYTHEVMENAEESNDLRDE
jgi:hypothetical protein